MKRNRWGMIAGLAVCASALGAATAQAAVTLPTATRIQLGGITAFDTEADPPIAVDTGDLFGAAIVGTDVDLTAIGRVTSIHEVNDASNTGSIPVGSELSVLFEGTFTVISAFEIPTADPDTRSYAVSSDISSGSLQIWEDPSEDLNIGDLVGTPLGTPPVIPGEATDGVLFLDATLSAGSGTSLVQVTFSRPDAASDFDSITTDLQILSIGGYDIVGGTLLDAFPGTLGEAINARQTAPGAPAAFPSIDLGGGLVISTPVDELVEGGFDVLFTIIPEPTSSLILGIGGLWLVRARGGRGSR